MTPQPRALIGARYLVPHGRGWKIDSLPSARPGSGSTEGYLLHIWVACHCHPASKKELLFPAWRRGGDSVPHSPCLMNRFLKGSVQGQPTSSSQLLCPLTPRPWASFHRSWHPLTSTQPSCQPTLNMCLPVGFLGLRGWGGDRSLCMDGCLSFLASGLEILKSGGVEHLC